MTVLRPGLPLLLLALSVPLLYLGWARWRPPLPPARSRFALGLRLSVVALLALSLADIRVPRQPRHRAIVLAVDLSDSAGASRDEAAAAVRAILATKPSEDLVGLVTFGRDAQVELAPARRPAFDGFQTRPDGSYSNLAGALQLAGVLMPDGYARQVVLLSDGRQNLGDAPSSVARLRERSVRVDVLPLGTPAGAETLVLALEAPRELRVGQPLTVTARLRATQPSSGRLVLQLDGREAGGRDVELPAGASDQRFELPPLDPGVHRLGVTLDASPDGYSQNDAAEAVVRVLGPPSVLVLEWPPGGGRNVKSALEAAGMRVETRFAEQAPTNVDALSRYDAVTVVDTPAEAFPPGALSAISTAVRDLGRGLVAFGGGRSFGPGGWKGTPLEEALPVRMEPPRPKERPSLAVALVMETMESEFGDAVALGAAQAMIDELTPDDEVAVLVMPASSGDALVPLQRAVDKVAIKDAIRNAGLGDPPGYKSSITAALDTLSQSRASVKHAIIVGDGDAISDVPTYGPMFEAAQAEGITISTVGVDTHSNVGNMEHMRSIAQRGGGHFYLSRTASDVPQVLLEETRTTMRPWFEQDPFFPTVASAGDLLEGVPLDAFPELGGYVVTTPKPTAEVALSSPKRDPVLAAAPFGLGRAMAWTSDTAGRWTDGLLRSPVAATLFGRMVAWSLPSTGEALRLDSVPRGDGLHVDVGGPPEGGDLQIDVVSPDQRTTTSQLSLVAPGRWDGTVPAGELGTYVVRAVLRRGGTVVGQAEALVPVPYSPEYLESGRDDGLLGQLAEQGGALLGSAAAAWSQPRLTIRSTSPIFWLLLLLAAVLWPLDVAVRRLTLSPARLVSSMREAWATRSAEQAEPGDVDDPGPPSPGPSRDCAVDQGPVDEKEPALQGLSLGARILEARQRREEDKQ